MELDTLLDEARDLFDETVALRRTLHRWPELGNDLPVTREHVLGALEGLPLQLTLHETTSGIFRHDFGLDSPIFHAFKQTNAFCSRIKFRIGQDRSASFRTF